MAINPDPGNFGSGNGPTILAEMAERRKRQNIILGISVFVVAIVGAIIGLAASGALQLGRANNTPPALSAQGSPAPKALELQGTPTAPVTQKVAEAPLEMPADIEAWLKHLEECERRKVEIAGDQQAEMMVYMQKLSVLGAGMGLLDPYDQSSGAEGDKDPGTYTQGKILDLRPRWEELIAFYNSVPAPAECQPLASDFGAAINEVPGMMGDVGQILNDITSNPEQAMSQAKKLQNVSFGNVDRSFARADQKLGAICAKYNKHKWFNIKSDVGGTGILGKNLFGG